VSAAGDIVVRFLANTAGFNRGVQGVRRQMGGLVAYTHRTAAGMGKLQASGRGAFGAMAFSAGLLNRSLAPLAGTMGLGLGFGKLASSGESFNRAMRNSLAIMGDVSAQMRGQLREAVLETAAAFKAGPAEAARGLYYLKSAGLDAAQSLAALPQVARFAQAGNFDMGRATELATDAQHAMGMVAKDAQANLRNLTRTTDVLTAANTLADATTEQFAESLTTKAGAAARTVGKDIEETVATLAAWADQGLKGADSGTAMNIVLRDLQTKALQHAAAFKQMNVRVFDSAGEMRNMADIVGDLERALGPMSDAQKKATLLQMGFTDKSVIFIQTLLGCSQKIRMYEAALRAAGGTTERVANDQLTPLQRGWSALEAALTRVGGKIMSVLGPTLEVLMKSAAAVINNLGVFGKVLIRVGSALTLVAGSIVVITVATWAYAAATKAAAVASVFLQGTLGPKAWGKLVAGVAAATGVIVAMEKIMARSQQKHQQMASGTGKVQQALDKLAEGKGPIKELSGALDEMAGSMEGLVAAQPSIGGALHDLIRDAAALRKNLQKAAEEGSAEVAGAFYAQPSLRRPNAISHSTKIALPQGMAPELRAEIRNMLQDFEKLKQLAGGLRGELGDVGPSLRGLLGRSTALQGSGANVSSESIYKRRARHNRAAAEFVEALRKQAQALAVLEERAGKVVEIFGSLEEAQQFLDSQRQNLQTPLQRLEQTKTQLRALFDLNQLTVTELQRLSHQADMQFDVDIGGPKAKLRELGDELQRLREGITQDEQALRRLAATPGVTSKQVERIRWMQGEIGRLQEKTQLKGQGEELRKRLMTPVEKARGAVDDIQKLFKVGAIDEQTRRRALREQANLLTANEQDGSMLVGAAEKGSVEAYSRIVQATSGRTSGLDAVAKNAAETARQQAKTNALLEEIKQDLEREPELIELPGG